MVNFAVAGLTALLVIPAELPDKTFISTLMLSAKNRALPVFAGALAGLILQAGVAAVAGRLLDLLPHEAVAAVVTRKEQIVSKR
jgi:putative Ca2+/H+ antiporter (TMEM165/GDT1 family)